MTEADKIKAFLDQCEFESDVVDSDYGPKLIALCREFMYAVQKEKRIGGEVASMRMDVTLSRAAAIVGEK